MLKIINNGNTLGYYDNIYGKLYTNNYEIITADIDTEEGTVSNHITCKNMIFTFDNNPRYKCTNSQLHKEDGVIDTDKFWVFLKNLREYLDKNPEIQYLDIYGSDIVKYINYLVLFVNKFSNKTIRLFIDTLFEPNDKIMSEVIMDILIKKPYVEFHIFGNTINEYVKKYIKTNPEKFWISVDISKLEVSLDDFYNELDKLYPEDIHPVIEYIDITNSDLDIEKLRNDIKNFCINSNGLNKCNMFARITDRIFSPRLDIQDCSTNHCFLYQIKPHVCTFNGELVRCPNCTSIKELGKDQNNYLGILNKETTYRKFSDNHWVCDRDEFKYIDKCLDCDVKAFCNFCDIDSSENMDNICCTKTKIIYGGVLDAIISMQFENTNFKLEEV